ncbi:MAG TPA: class I SAM-dependent methyltransferase [Solirubrobacterales bacterium]|nr:class I SAM-dependent methyltransferase [Solirubrobacterales bacterium]
MLKHWAGGDQARATYDQHAATYERFVRGYEYERWSTRLLEVASAAGMTGTRLLDIGCGTGLSSIVPLRRGFQVTACDVSPRMIEIAQAKLGSEADLRVVDMRDMPCLGRFDLVWALNDSVNYLLSRDELVAALTGMALNLAENGLALFDLNTLAGYRGLFCESLTVEDASGSMKWRGLTDPMALRPGAICEASYTVEGSERDETLHRQRHFSSEEIFAALRRAGLSAKGTYGELDGRLFQPLDEDLHTKAVYLADLA